MDFPKPIVSQRTVELPSGREAKLRLRRYPRDGAKRSVLLLHGANTSGDSFLEPNGGLAAFLHAADLDVWVLDWRGSPWVQNQLKRSVEARDVVKERASFNIEAVASFDLPFALREMEQLGKERPISIVAFCIGAGALSLAIARKNLLTDHPGVDRIVLMTLGLFYQPPWDTWLKSREYLLEQVAHHDPDCEAIDPDPQTPWPAALQQAFERWREASSEASPVGQFDRLAFMYGEPYARNVVKFAPEKMFGPLHLGFYLQAADMVRRGYPRELFGPADPNGKAMRDEFRKLKHVMLLGGAQNRLWHRESLDVMYEWLLRGVKMADPTWCRKLILGDYAHLDLLWSEHAPKVVYPQIREAVAPTWRTSRLSLESTRTGPRETFTRVRWPFWKVTGRNSTAS